jgi:hypothetical protein
MRRVTLRVAALVGTPVATVFFAVLAALSLPEVIKTGNLIVIVAWTTQSFLQLVLLPIILFSTNESAASTDKVIHETHDRLVEYLEEIHATAQNTNAVAKATHAHVTNVQE